ncbi:MAG: hypothetical protein ACE5O2_09610 [Armatimonadota bacterium]
MRTPCLSIILTVALCFDASAQPPITLVENGGFERGRRAWQLGQGCGFGVLTFLQRR